MSTQKIISIGVKKTQEVAVKIARQILTKTPKGTAVLLALEGDLGAGKTTFVQGFAKGLGIEDKILSPTFNIMKKFKIYKLRFKNFYHIDCYRLKNEKDLEVLGFKKIISDPKNIIAIEWPERIKKILPINIIKIEIKHEKENKRTLIINGII